MGEELSARICEDSLEGLKRGTAREEVSISWSLPRVWPEEEFVDSCCRADGYCACRCPRGGLDKSVRDNPFVELERAQGLWNTECSHPRLDHAS